MFHHFRGASFVQGEKMMAAFSSFDRLSISASREPISQEFGKLLGISFRKLLRQFRLR